MKRKIPENREWITISGRKMLWDKFIYLVIRDCFSELNNFSHLDSVKEKSKRMLYLLEDWTVDYTKGINNIDGYEDVLNRYNISINQRKLPEAIDVLFDEFRESWFTGITTRLDIAESRSEIAYEILKKERKQDALRKEVVKKIYDSYPHHDDSVIGKINFLIYLQGAKKECDYAVSKEQLDKERIVMELWISVLVHSISSEFLTHAQMLSFVQNRLLEESDFTNLLRYKYNEDRDYEWYSEDFLGLELSHNTIIRINDALTLVEPFFRDILGF